MELRRYRFNRKVGKVYLEVGNQLSEIGSTLKMIILWASAPIFGKPFAHLSAQNWVQITFLDMQGNWCYALLNNGTIDALNPWLQYRKQVESELELCGVITTISLVKFEEQSEFFEYSFAGVRGKPGLEERMKTLIDNSGHALVDTSVNLLT
ncbi:MAG: hypothetical protein HEQ25_13635 [Dolichospermum sp. DET73]|nr:hypothetical protein [Dolichospermum sp. DET73]